LSAAILTLPYVFKSDTGSNLDFGSEGPFRVDLADAVTEVLVIGYGWVMSDVTSDEGYLNSPISYESCLYLEVYPLLTHDGLSRKWRPGTVLLILLFSFGNIPKCLVEQMKFGNDDAAGSRGRSQSRSGPVDSY
jgi:hypothetical protein